MSIAGKIILVALAISAVSILSASTAVAAEPQWLVGGVAVEEALAAETTGELEFRIYAEATEPSAVLTVILCSLILDGFIGSKGRDEFTDMLILEETATIGENLEGEFLNCTTTFDNGGVLDCKENTLTLLWVDNLKLNDGLAEDTWPTQLSLVGGMFFDLYTSNLAGVVPGYDVECETLSGANLANLCEGTLNPLVENELTAPPSVLSSFKVLPLAERLNCSLTGMNTADIVGSAKTWAVGHELENLETSIANL